jgi:putative acetyltransferase
LRLLNTPMHIRTFQPGDEAVLWRLFFDTIRGVNIRDYTYEQVCAWAPDEHDPERWAARIRGLNPFICEVNSVIAGYADLQPTGYIDHFYVSKDFQRKGVGSRLFDRIRQEAISLQLRELTADVSITARPFFEHFEFTVVKMQSLDVNGVTLRNFHMRCELCP